MTAHFESGALVSVFLMTVMVTGSLALIVHAYASTHQQGCTEDQKSTRKKAGKPKRPGGMRYCRVDESIALHRTGLTKLLAQEHKERYFPILPTIHGILTSTQLFPLRSRNLLYHWDYSLPYPPCTAADRVL